MIVGIYKKKYCLKFQSVQDCFFYFLRFCLVHIVVDSMDIYNSKKTKKMSNHAVRKLHYLLRYVPDQYKTQQMCDNAIL